MSERSRSALPIDLSPQSPEQRLMAAVLKQAVDDLRLSRGYHGASWLTQVEEWFRARELEWPFSFENVCVGLGLDADLIRDMLRTGA